MTNTIDPSLIRQYQGQKQREASSVLGKDDFLQLLMVQLQNQDPMNPMQDKDFIAQMATFSTLEQITNLNQLTQQSLVLQQQSQLISYNQFIGKEVKWHKLTNAEIGKPLVTEEGVGKVVSVQFKDGAVQFILDDGTKLEPGNISEINETSTGNAMMQASMMIGKTVTYVAEEEKDKEEKISKIKSVSFKDGKVQFELEDGTHITASQIKKIE